MAEPEFTLEFIGRTMMAMREEMRDLRAEMNHRFETMDDRLVTIEGTLNRHQDELTVTTAMVMRHASEPIAWSAMERQIKRLSERLDKVETRLPAE